MKRTISAVLASILALMLSPAIASPAASASLTGYGYELIDLNPNDGIAPSIALTGQSAWVATAAYRDVSGYPYLLQILSGEGTSEVADAAGHSRAYWGPDGAVVSASANNNLFYADVILGWDFVLSPFTTVIFRGHGSGTQNTAGGVSYGGAQLYAIYGPDEYAYFSDSTGYDFGPISRDLVLSITAGATEISGTTGFSAIAVSGDFPSAIPEPSSIATLLAGLCVLHVSRRKRIGAVNIKVLS